MAVQFTVTPYTDWKWNKRRDLEDDIIHEVVPHIHIINYKALKMLTLSGELLIICSFLCELKIFRSPLLNTFARAGAVAVLVGRIVIPSLLGRCKVLQKGVAQMSHYLDSLKNSPFAEQSTLFFINVCKTVVKKASFQEEIDQINATSAVACVDYTLKIHQVAASIQRMEAFILTRPDLVRLSFEGFQEEGDVIRLPDGIQAIDFQQAQKEPDPVKREIALKSKFHEISFLWESRLRFIQRHPELRDRMLKHMQASYLSDTRLITHILS